MKWDQWEETILGKSFALTYWCHESLDMMPWEGSSIIFMVLLQKKMQEFFKFQPWENIGWTQSEKHSTK